MASGDAGLARADAEAAARDGEFGVIDTSDHENDQAPNGWGTICFTPFGRVPLVLSQYGLGDYTRPGDGIRLAYISAYNRTLVEQPNYPYRDLCRTLTTDDQTLVNQDRSLVTIAARTVKGPPRDLFEAARRGSAQEVRRFINRKSLNAVDNVGMTALGWAVARNNRPALNVLLSAGAKPWTQGVYSYDSVYWAAALGRQTMFERLARVGGRLFRSWPSYYLSAALTGNNRAILRTMLTQQHDEVRIEFLSRPLPDPAMFELLFAKHPELATKLLFKAMPLYFDSRPDLVRLALANGADPNAVQDYKTPLLLAADSIEPHSLEVLDLLLKGGADPNLRKLRSLPVWEAYGSIQSDESGRHWKPTGLPRAKYDRLIAAGASLKLPNWQGLPPIWFLLFPFSFDRTRFDSSMVTPKLLEMLVRDGLDLNAEWNGKRVLGDVEDRTGPDSELAKTLRRLGAKP